MLEVCDECGAVRMQSFRSLEGIKFDVPPVLYRMESVLGARPLWSVFLHEEADVDCAHTFDALEAALSADEARTLAFERATEVETVLEKFDKSKGKGPLDTTKLEKKTVTAEDVAQKKK